MLYYAGIILELDQDGPMAPSSQKLWAIFSFQWVMMLRAWANWPLTTYFDGSFSEISGTTTICNGTLIFRKAKKYMIDVTLLWQNKCSSGLLLTFGIAGKSIRIAGQKSQSKAQLYLVFKLNRNWLYFSKQCSTSV